MRQIKLNDDLVSFTLDDVLDGTAETFQQRYERLRKVYDTVDGGRAGVVDGSKSTATTADQD
ncbi:MAG: hypothetical protein JWO56_590 [Acidobacteria bacterium]|nr:hypothetical protein [Acidobacteriota bacterium]